MRLTKQKHPLGDKKKRRLNSEERARAKGKFLFSSRHKIVSYAIPLAPFASCTPPRSRRGRCAKMLRPNFSLPGRQKPAPPSSERPDRAYSKRQCNVAEGRTENFPPTHPVERVTLGRWLGLPVFDFLLLNCNVTNYFNQFSYLLATGSGPTGLQGVLRRFSVGFWFIVRCARSADRWQKAHSRLVWSRSLLPGTFVNHEAYFPHWRCYLSLSLSISLTTLFRGLTTGA